MLFGPITNRLSVAAIVASASYLFAFGLLGPQQPAVHFGVWMPTASGEVLVDSEAAPLVEGVRFGWVLAVPADDDAHVVREELILPSAPETWIVGPETVLSEDRTRATTTRVLPGQDRTMEHTWRILDGDPPGRYVVRVWVDDHLVFEDSLVFEPPPKFELDPEVAKELIEQMDFTIRPCGGL
jgi:hypothetical protein